MKLEVLSIRRVQKGGALKGRASVRVGSAIIHDWRIVERTPQARAEILPPQRLKRDRQTGELRDNGPIVELPPDVLAAVVRAVRVAWGQTTGRYVP